MLVSALEDALSGASFYADNKGFRVLVFNENSNMRVPVAKFVESLDLKLLRPRNSTKVSSRAENTFESSARVDRLETANGHPKLF
jgi:hypothetical protein